MLQLSLLSIYFFICYIQIGYTAPPCFKSNDNIKTFQVLQNSNQLYLPIIDIKQQSDMKIAFDYLGEVYNTLLYIDIKICDENWELVDIAPIHYSSGNRRKMITNFLSSISSKSKYYHIEEPLFDNITINRSGNYLIQIYQEEVDTPIYQHPLILSDNSAKLNIKTKNNNLNFKLSQAFQLEMNLTFEANNIPYNPINNIKIFTLHNSNWNTWQAMSNQPIQKNELEFSYGEMGDMQFQFLPPFYFIQTDNLNTRNNNVSAAHLQKNNLVVIVDKDNLNRINIQHEYSSYPGYYTPLLYPATLDKNIAADYAIFDFALNVEQQIYPIFILGQFNQSCPTTTNQMHYNKSEKQYQGELLLKQGHYQYMYTAKQESTMQPLLEVNTANLSTQHIAGIIYYYNNPSLPPQVIAIAEIRL